MGRRLVKGKKDADKDRAELIAELNGLRDFNSRLKDVVKRYEKVAGKKELYSSLYDLESDKDSIESLCDELRENQTEVDIRGEELGVQNEELRVHLDEINAHTEEIVRISEALRESEASLARSQAIAHLGNWKVDVSTNRVRGSDELYRMFNLGPDVALDAYIGRMHPDDRLGVVESIKAAFYEGKPYSNDYRIVPRPGEIHYVHAEGETTRDSDGRPLTFFGTVQDITERKQAEERKRAEEERLRLVHDLQERVKEQKALYSAARIFQHQHTIQEVLQEIVATLPPAWQYPSITTARIVYDGREYRAPGFCVGAWSQSADFVTIDGKRGTIEVFYVEETPPEAKGPFLAEERNLINSLAEMLCIYLDRNQAEEELKSAKTQAELYLDLMGHDINNMHQIALGYLELARDIPACEGQTQSLDKSIEVLHRSTRLIQNVKKLKNLRKGSFQTKEVDVCKVLSEIQREFGAVPNKSVSLNLKGCEHCRVRANELLHDVYANLVINAIKHTGDHADIFINLERAEENGQSYCRVSVEDNGPGIPDDNKDTIFNRALRSTSKAKGMGLGLYFVKSLMDGYNGRVWVEDRVPGDHTKGARFVVMLPAVETESH